MNRGNVLSRNRFENIFVREKPALGAPSINAVYFDDELSQQTLVNNTFSNCWVGLLLGGGRDNIVQGNTFTDLRGPYAVTFDARGLGWQKVRGRGLRFRAHLCHTRGGGLGRIHATLAAVV